VQGVRATAQGGAVLSGIVGGVVSSPEKTATPGAVAQPKPAYRLTVHMDDGRRQVFTQNVISPNLRIGSPVRINDGRVVLLR
jgi:outer membrane lipoprotein SlyB